MRVDTIKKGGGPMMYTEIGEESEFIFNMLRTPERI